MISRRIPLLLAAFSLPLAGALAQIPTKCLEIESILVDACNPNTLCPGSSEGQNEMVRFRTGPEPLSLIDISVTWPNNPWRGFIQTAQTAALTAQLNASIVNCGHLLEPPSGVIPPGSRVILVGSVDMCPAANSFANLTDTIYITFQATGNLANHFPNHNNPTGSESPVPLGASVIETLIMTHVPTACRDTVQYDRRLLVNQNGTYGGNMLINNGATVDFTWPGVPVATYYNNDCQAPVDPLLVSAQPSGPICDGGTVQLTGTVSGSYDGVQWQGGTGSFADPNAISTSYTAGPGDNGTVVLQLCVTGACDQESVCVDVPVDVSSGPQPTITADGPLSICPGQSLTLTASGADSYDWGAQGTAASIVVTAPGTYTVTGTNICGTGQASVEVVSAESVTVTIDGPTQVCPGQPVQLTASGADSYLWSTNESTATITVDQPGVYSVTGSTSCGSGQASITLVAGSSPDVTIAGVTVFCGTPFEITASGADTYLWSTGDTTLTITVTGPGDITVTGSTSCGSASETVSIVAGQAPAVSITGATEGCAGDSLVLTASGADSFVWSTTATTPSITVTETGVYSVTGTTVCGTDQASVTVTFRTAPTVSIAGDTTLCPTARLTALGDGTFAWSTGDTTSSITVHAPGTYRVTMTDACGTSSASVQVIESPLGVQIVAQPTEGLAPLPVQFNALVDGGSAILLWDLGDGTSSTEQSPQHTYTAEGEYVVMVTAEQDGCTAQAEVVIMVYGEPMVEVPNVFTPNGDGQNDVLQLTVRGIQRVHLALYNRWGQEVYKIERTHQVWDGRTMAGEPAPEGTYYYLLEAEAINGDSFRTHGHVTILR
jgi:gliding motility-associated-like protein